MSEPRNSRRQKPGSDPAVIGRRIARERAEHILEDLDGRQLPGKLKQALHICMGKMNAHAGNLSYIGYGELADRIGVDRRQVIFLLDVLQAVGAICKVYTDRDEGRARIQQRFGFDIGSGPSITLNFYTFNPDWPGFRRVDTRVKGRNRSRPELPPDMVELIRLMFRERRAKGVERESLLGLVETARKRFEVTSMNTCTGGTGATINSGTGATQTGNLPDGSFPLTEENDHSGLSFPRGTDARPEGFSSTGEGVVGDGKTGQPSTGEAVVGDGKSGQPSTGEGLVGDGISGQPTTWIGGPPTSTPAAATRPATSQPADGKTSPSARKPPTRPEGRPALEAAPVARETPSEPAGFPEFAAEWNLLAQACSSVPIAPPGSEVRRQLLAAWQDLPALRETWPLLLVELAGNQLLAGRQPNREGRTLSLTASWLFRRRHDSGYLNWEAIALGEFNRAGNQAEPLERRVAWAVRDWRDCRQPDEEFPAYLARSGAMSAPM